MLKNTALKVMLAAALFFSDMSGQDQREMERVLDGIALVESRSYYDIDGYFQYIDTRVGKAGERGPYQMTRIAFNQIKKPGETFARLSTDFEFARTCANRYLNWLLANSAKGNVGLAIEYYNSGPNRRSRTYLQKVYNAMQLLKLQ